MEVKSMRMRITDHRGHTVLEEPKHTVSEIEAEFNRIVSNRAVPFDTTDRKNPKKMETFDPEVEEITAIAPMAGGR